MDLRAALRLANSGQAIGDADLSRLHRHVLREASVDSPPATPETERRRWARAARLARQREGYAQSQRAQAISVGDCESRISGRTSARSNRS